MSVPFILMNTKPHPGEATLISIASPVPKAALLDTDQEHSEVQRQDVSLRSPQPPLDSKNRVLGQHPHHSPVRTAPGRADLSAWRRTGQP